MVVFDLFKPFGMHFVPFPLVGQDAGVSPFPVVYIETCCAAAVAFDVEGRVGGDEINGFAVHAA